MSKQVKQNIGILLLTLLMGCYIYVFSPKPSAQQASSVHSSMESPVVDSAIQQLQSNLPTPNREEDQEITLSNKVMKVVFSKQSGHIKEVLLKKYQNYDGKPLVVLDKAHRISLKLPTSAGVIQSGVSLCEVVENSTAQLPNKQGNTSITFIYRTSGESEGSIKQTFSLSEESYQVDCHIETEGVDLFTEGEDPTLIWYQPLKRLEKDAFLSTKETMLHYYYADRGKVTYLSGNHSKEKVVNLEESIGWVSAKQKFFTAGVASSTPFTKAKLIANPVESDAKELLKEVGMKLTLNRAALAQGTKLTFYFGPNDYDCLQGVAPKFEANLYLGITPFKQINKYMILPLAKYLENYFDHYLLILLILLLILALLQLPLTYKGYISQIQQDTLAPMIDEIKEHYADDPLAAQVKENTLRTKAGVSLGSSLIPVLLQIPIFFSVMNFVKYHIGFRQASFLWIEDLSTYDSLIQLPFRLPILGRHISILALLASCIMMIPTLVQKRKIAERPETKFMPYLFPLILFFALNSASSAFNLYRMISELVNLIPKSIFRLVVNPLPIQEAIKARLATKDLVSSPPRAQKRLAKRIQKKDS